MSMEDLKNSWHLCNGVSLQVMHGEAYIMETLHGRGGMDHQVSCSFS